MLERGRLKPSNLGGHFSNFLAFGLTLTGWFERLFPGKERQVRHRAFPVGQKSSVIDMNWDGRGIFFLTWVMRR